MKKEYVIVVKNPDSLNKEYYRCEHGGCLFTELSLEFATISSEVKWLEQVCDYLRATYKDYQFGIHTLN